jgi:anti-sigma factor RsiW
MLSCKDVAARSSALIDGELSVWTVLQLRMHLAMCKGCRRFVDQMRRTDRLTADLAGAGTGRAPAAGDARFAALLEGLRTRNDR